MAVAAVGLPGAACCWLLRLLSFLLVAGPALCWNDPDRILLRDVKALTLHHDRYTTSRRLDPIPQLKCVGGTAGCDAFTPKVIQCQNKGWDGYDVQWECKTDLDIAYKFGKTVVSCEGYESSEDQYVLRGSCGLEYNLDYTELGLKKLKESGKHQGFSDYYHKLYSSDSSGVGGLVTIGVLLALAYVVYKLFLSDGQGSPPPYSEYPPYSQHYSRFTSAAGAPPPGFKSEFTGPQNPGYGAASGFGSAFTGQGCDSSGPGFWTGLGAGGLLGYLFGSNRAATPFSDSWPYPPCPPSYSGTWNSRVYSPPGRGTASFSASSSTDSRTRTASAYGGTRRR
ncbi:store-operated calcium entry-associated regulatory factor isoform X1 [Meriones unguiculatus]|uniref:store-operated calcium entry-associated regulatory factor isoform X1 n=1 Tax=Meriones unguiculatus TaxID=10047 RepID=UPI000B4F7D06|nr:store-operated calcium entry-associated regulatory factor isoform X1 [Meriones unguiculatus]